MVNQIKFLTMIFAFFLLLTACSVPESEPRSVEPETAEPKSVLSATVPPNEVEIESLPTGVLEPVATETPMPTQTNNFDTFSLIEPFSLAGGETAVIDTNDLQLTFTEVLEDSRCPTEVNCFWSGQARILIIAEQAGQSAVELEFNTNPAPNETIDTLPAYEYIVHLEQLDPYPKNPENPIAFEAYQAQLVVTRP